MFRFMMRFNMKKILMILPVLMIVGACSQKTTAPVDNDSTNSVVTSLSVVKKPVSGVAPVNAVLKASAFRMSGDYASNVAIGVTSNGTLSYFPAPSDITVNSAPVDLGNGWWLNRQGVGEGYKFTKYTFEEYSALKEVPSPKTLLESVIPGAVVTVIRTFDIPASEAMSHLEEIKSQLGINKPNI